MPKQAHLLSPEGKESRLAVHSSGNIFGELCLARLGARRETAAAMKETKLKQISCDQVFARSSRAALSDRFVRYLAVRIADPQQVIANLTVSMLRFHNLGLVERNRDRFLVIKETKLTADLAQIALERPLIAPEARDIFFQIVQF